MRLISSPRRALGLVAAATSAALLLAGCGGSGASGTSGGGGQRAAGGSTQAASTIKKDPKLAAMVPKSVKADGKVVVATDPTYAPMEFVAKDNKTIIGVDPDLGQALGKVLGVKFQFQKATFDAIIPGLDSGKYELGMSAFTDTKKREQIVDFVTYFKAGTSLMVPAGNPKKLSPEGMSLCGMRVAAEKGTIQSDDDIPSRSKKCKAEGKKPLEPQIYPDQNGVNLALSTGRTDAALADSGVAAYMAKKSGDQFEVTGQPYATAPYGVAVPKGSGDFTKVLRGAIEKLMDGGAYQKILAKWGEQDNAIQGSQINVAKS
ncbi:MAG: ABC transporter substrate-binding protein [Streptosporangiaceae bacterium]